jgi:RpiR family carbohydrate utilization transcriptional regulator
MGLTIDLKATTMVKINTLTTKENVLHPNGSILAIMNAKKAEFSSAELKIFDAIIANGIEMQWMILKDFAAHANVSEPTVMRFCRAIGLKSFSDFKIRLAQSLSRPIGNFHRKIHSSLPLNELAEKVFEAAQEEIAQAKQMIDINSIDSATRILVSACRIDVYATGSGNIVAAAAYQNLMRLGLTISHTNDAHIQTHSAATLNSGDVAMIFSFTGEVRDNIRCAKIAREAGATTIAFTRRDSHLAKEVDLVVPIDPYENTFEYSPMSASVAHMVIADILTTSVGLALGNTAAALIKRVKASLEDQWLGHD